MAQHVKLNALQQTPAAPIPRRRPLAQDDGEKRAIGSDRAHKTTGHGTVLQTPDTNRKRKPIEVFWKANLIFEADPIRLPLSCRGFSAALDSPSSV